MNFGLFELEKRQNSQNVGELGQFSYAETTWIIP